MSATRELMTSVYRSGQEVVVLTASDTLNAGDLLPGFSLPLSEIFGGKA
jgi:hypothetical protein